MKTYAGENTLAALASIIKNAISSAVSGAGGGVPSGVIMMWHGTVDTVPDGWAVCDGTNGTLDLRDKFALCSGPTYPVGETGGEAEHKLTVAEMPIHNHYFWEKSTYATTYANRVVSYQDYRYNRQSNSSFTTGDSGGDEAHNNMPPYYALLYIMKL